jgi:hypothetical protein
MQIEDVYSPMTTQRNLNVEERKLKQEEISRTLYR